MTLDNYHFNPHCLPLFIMSSLVLTMGILILSKDFNSIKNKHFFILCFGIFIWLTATAIAYLSKDEKVATLWFKIDNFGVMFISPSFYAFSCALVNERRSKSIILGYLIALLFGLIGITHSYFVDHSILYYWGYFPQWKILNSVPFFIFWFGYSIASFRVLINALRNSPSGYFRNQIKFVLLAFTFAYLGSIDYLATSGIEVYPMGFIPIFTLVSVIFYAIIKHKLMDFNLIVRWTLAYAITIIILLAFTSIGGVTVNELFIKKFKFGFEYPVLISSCIAVLIFDPLRKGISKYVDRVIFKSPDFQSIILGFTLSAENNPKLEVMLETYSNHLKNTWNISHAGFVIWNPSTAKYDLYPKNNFLTFPISKMHEQMTPSDFLIKTLETERRLFKYGIVIKDEIVSLGQRAFPGEKITFSKISRTMNWLGAAVCIPLMKEEQLQGIIVLGNKKVNSFYNEEDKKFLAHVSTLISVEINKELNIEYELNKSMASPRAST